MVMAAVDVTSFVSAAAQAMTSKHWEVWPERPAYASKMVLPREQWLSLHDSLTSAGFGSINSWSFNSSLHFASTHEPSFNGHFVGCMLDDI